MQTIRYLSDAAYADLFWPPVVAGLAIAVMCSALSVLVVLKRLAFVGQGVSHAAFGAVGLVAVLGAYGVGVGGAGTRLIVLGFCVGAAVLIALLTGKKGRHGAGSGAGSGLSADTAIGIVLTVSMALGFVLLRWSWEVSAARGVLSRPPSVESVLFGSIVEVGWGDAVWAWVAAVFVGFALVLVRRGLLFWAFDESASAAFGVAGGRMRLLLMVLLAIAIVTTMGLAGVVLATAMLVLPGATALAVSDRLAPVFVLSMCAGVLGILGGIVVGFEFDVQVGPAIVLVQSLLFCVAKCVCVVVARGNGLRGGQGGGLQSGS